jgi:DNA-binding NarL/FixJ family response regulator
VNDGESILTLLYNLSQKKKESSFFKFKFTSRELVIIDLVNQELSNKDITDELFICPKTLKNHINNIQKKIRQEHWPRYNQNKIYF